MYQVIARKYRPQSFADLIGQEHVRTTLENAVVQNRIAHGYIFAGQRGTGKTTVARIMARCLNCVEGPVVQPCGVCASCLEIAASNAVDVIEIDAASNRGINEMRELRESVRYRPARDRFKVFIIDEAHQITNEAFNALLKTLEEPPEWVVFMLCTTESHKIPATIASRCQQFSFRSVEFRLVLDRLRWICQQEGVEADEAALAVLAQAGEGSVRDSLSALDQAIACCGTKLDAGQVRGLLGLFSLDVMDEFSQALRASDTRRMLEMVQELEANGHSLQHFCRELARYLRNLLVARIAGGLTRLIAAPAEEQQRLLETAAGFSEEDLTRYLQLTLNTYSDLQTSLQPRLHLEIGLLRLVHAGRLQSLEEALASLPAATASAPAAKPAAPAPRLPVPAAVAPKPRSGPSPLEADRARKQDPQAMVTRARAPLAAAAIEAPPAPLEGDVRTSLHAALMELGLTYSADALDRSHVVAAGGEVVILAPPDARLFLKETDVRKALQSMPGAPQRVRIEFRDPGVEEAPARPPSEGDPETEARALAHPEVQRFRELFPDSSVRVVRNLKEGS